MKKWICVLVSLCLLLSSFGIVSGEEAAEEQLIFSDIADSWAKAEIEELAASGIINGVAPGEFAPDREISRAEFLTMIFRLLKLSPIDYEQIYPDVAPEAWYADTLQTAYELGLLDKTGFGGSFYGESAINREEMASLLAKGYALYCGEAEAEENDYSDESSISDWAKGYVETVSSLGVMQGKEENSFDPKGKATRAETAAVVLRMMKSFETAGLDPSQMPWKQAPVIYKISDEISPGEAFNIYGAGLTEKTKLYLEPAETAGSEPGENAVLVDIALCSSIESYITAVLPESLAGGIYKVWTENEYGMGNALLLNAPRLFWMGCSDITYEGLTMQLIGVGFMPERVGFEGETMVKMTVNGKDYPVEITTLEPYSIKFTVPEGIALGEYQVSVTTNGGKNWVTLDNEQKLSVVAPGDDPYDLGFAWEKNYVYDYKVNVKDFGAKGDGASDDTEAIAAAMADVHAHGGGIVYFPIGTYKASTIQMPDHIILEGESRTASKLAYSGTDPKGYFIWNTTEAQEIGYNGLTNLTFTVIKDSENFSYPDMFMWVGRPWEVNSIYSTYNRHNEGFFVKGCTYDLPMESPNGPRMYQYAVLKKYFLIDDIEGQGYHMGFMPTTGDYSTIRNTNQTVINSSNESTGCYTVYENNVIDLRSDILNADGSAIYAQGIFLRSHAYLAHNRISNTGTPGTSQNDGEIFCTENPNGGTIRYAGNVTNATTNSVSFTVRKTSAGEPEAFGYYGLDVSNEYPRFGTYYVQIVDGRGLGQMRRMSAHEVNGDIYTISIDRPWDIVPDSTSKILYTTTSVNCVYYDNDAENCEKGYWFYGGAYDSIVDNVRGNGVEGILARNFEIESSARRTYGYFVVDKNCSFTNASKLGDVCAISNDVAYEVKEESFGIGSYGAEIRSNSMKGALYPASAVKNTEANKLNGIFLGYSSPWIAPEVYFIHGAIIENNSLTNMTDGITLGAEPTYTKEGKCISGVVLKGNTFTNVKNHINIRGTVENLVEIDQ